MKWTVRGQNGLKYFLMNSSGSGELLLTAGYALKQTTKVMALNHCSPFFFFSLVLSCALVSGPYMSTWC